MRIQTSNRTRRRVAFTLMELLVVVAILVILASVGTLGFLQMQKSATQDIARTNIENIVKAAQAYASKNGGELPDNLQELVTSGLLEQKALLDPWQQPYQYSAEGGPSPSKPLVSTTVPKTGVVINNLN